MCAVPIAVALTEDRAQQQRFTAEALKGLSFGTAPQAQRFLVVGMCAKT